MSKTEFVSPEGFRIDGRRPSEIRTFRCQVGGVSQNADGSAYVEMGCTKALAYVYGPKEVHVEDIDDSICIALSFFAHSSLSAGSSGCDEDAVWCVDV